MSLLLLVILPAAASDRKTLGEIDFYGYKGLNPETILSALPFREGDPFPPARVKSSDELKRRVKTAVKQVIGHEATDVSFVCCDLKSNWMVYIGLPGESFEAITFNPAPVGDARLPKVALALRRKMENAWTNAVMKGNAAEDDSAGFTLTNEPQARKAELAIRDYALHNETLILEVLRSSADARHRAIAAQMLGYGRQSDEQITALVGASLDEDDDVRNDAVRALEVLAGARPAVAQNIPIEPFIRLLRSGSWSDHNKASLLLVALTKTRDSRVLEALRSEAADALVEMARWHNAGHAEAALLILGRLKGITDEQLNQLIDAHQVDDIIGPLN